MISTRHRTALRLRGRASARCALASPTEQTACQALAVFPTAAYLKAGDGHDAVLAILRPDALRMPNGVVLDGAPPDLRTRVQPGDEGIVAPGWIRIGGLEVRLDGSFVPDPVRRVTADSASHRSPPDTSMLQADPTLRARARQLAVGLAARDAGGLVDLVGAGPGLTPTGDDVTCGVVLVGLAAGAIDPSWTARALAAVGTRTTSLSAALLSYAARGLAVPPVVTVVNALMDPAGGLSPRHVADVHAIGHSSGRDLCAGIAGAIDAYLPELPTTTTSPVAGREER